MLSGYLARVRRNPVPAVVVLVAGLLLGVSLGAMFDKSGSSNHARVDAASRGESVKNATAAARSDRKGKAQLIGPGYLPPASAGSNGVSNTPLPSSARLQTALDNGVERAEQLGGQAAAAVWVGDSAGPLTSGNTTSLHRMWSISKAVVTIAALEATHDRPGPELAIAMADAIRRSDNCAIRRVIVGLQQLLGRGVEGTMAAFDQVLERAGVGLERAPSAAPAEQACVRYLENHQGELSDNVLGAVPQFGTAEWTLRDAIAFAHALATEEYGAPGAYLLKLMALPKEPPLEEPPQPSAPPLNWGAGAVLPSAWRPAWKGGWGGSQDSPPHYLAGQIVTLTVKGVPVAATALFAPDRQPPNDNPGITEAPHALETMFAAVREGLEAEPPQ